MLERTDEFDGDGANTRLTKQAHTADSDEEVLRLLFTCCSPELPATQQIALALRTVSGLTTKEIARAFLMTEAAIEQRIAAADRIVASARVLVETLGAEERARRLPAVAAMVYLLFNEGYSASGGTATLREPLCEQAIRLSRLLLRFYPADPEIIGLTALLLLQHARARARLDANGEIVLLDNQDRRLWNRELIEEGLVLTEKALRQRAPGPYQLQAAIAAVHARAATAEDTDWGEIELLYRALEDLQPSPVITLNRAVAVAKLRGPATALAMTSDLADRLSDYFYYHGVRGMWLKELGRIDEARAALAAAMALAPTPAQAAHIRRHIDTL